MEVRTRRRIPTVKAMVLEVARNRMMIVPEVAMNVLEAVTTNAIEAEKVINDHLKAGGRKVVRAVGKTHPPRTVRGMMSTKIILKFARLLM